MSIMVTGGTGFIGSRITRKLVERGEESQGGGKMPEVMIGQVTHYYSRIGVAALKLEAPLHKDDRLHFLGRTTDCEQTVQSMEIEHRSVDVAGVGDDVAIQVMMRVREGDKVYRQMESPTITTA